MEQFTVRKLCSKCGEISAHGLVRNRPGKVNGWCRACRAFDERLRRVLLGDEYRRRQRERYAVAGYFRRKAKVEVMLAVKSGRLEVPQACSRCNGDSRLDAHHADYFESLQVEWLCRVCHRAVTDGRLPMRP